MAVHQDEARRCVRQVNGKPARRAVVKLHHASRRRRQRGCVASRHYVERVMPARTATEVIEAVYESCCSNSRDGHYGRLRAKRNDIRRHHRRRRRTWSRRGGEARSRSRERPFGGFKTVAPSERISAGYGRHGIGRRACGVHHQRGVTTARESDGAAGVRLRRIDQCYKEGADKRRGVRTPVGAPVDSPVRANTSVPRLPQTRA